MSLTPLGKQLRSVLASLRNVTCAGSLYASPRPRRRNPATNATATHRPKAGPTVQAKTSQHGAVRWQSTAAAVTEEEEPPVEWSTSMSFTGEDQETNPVSRDGHNNTVGRKGRNKNDIHQEMRMPGSGRRARNHSLTVEEAREPSRYQLEKLLHRRVQYKASVDPELGTSLAPSASQIEALASSGYSELDLEEWAEIVATPASFDAAIGLSERVQAHGFHSTPSFVLSCLLRRDYISARALRALIHLTNEMLSARSKADQLADSEIFIIFSRLVRHARKVWPATLDRIAQILLENLTPVPFHDGTPDLEHMQHLTDMLNQALRLLTFPTAIQPVKNNIHQEAALVRVLQFMTDHSPTLQITREGYRAVVLLQLAQRKTEKEQQWAEVKALSWPPWKQDRTAIDSFITADEHGVSRAVGTLLRMREAGYAPLAWENTAMIYAGWDVDRTPTIQTLTLLGLRGTRVHANTSTWAARIIATRTAQEAWAAFLAYEDEKLEPDPEVYFAMLNKLFRESLRGSLLDKCRRRAIDAAAADNVVPNRTWRLFPGDAKEVSPLPPSVHLYTYTRSLPPTVDAFYLSMRQKGLEFDLSCTAFLIANARDLKVGIEYVEDSGFGQEVVRPLVSLDMDYAILDVPMQIYAAFIQLLCRFSKVPIKLNTTESGLGISTRKQFRALRARSIKQHTAIVHAIALLEWRQPQYPPPYNLVLQALGHESSYESVRSVQSPDVTFRKVEFGRNQGYQERERPMSAITAYNLGKRVLNFMRKAHLDLDIDGFRALCHMTENATVASWTTISNILESPDQSMRRWAASHQWEALEWPLKNGPVLRLRSAFRDLVGDESNDKEVAELSDKRLTTLLEVPSFSLLHLYVRALGWRADWKGLQDAAQWMHVHAAELAKRAEQDRNGDIMMHRTLCALRVFLERSWLPAPEETQIARFEQTQAEKSNEDEGDPVLERSSTESSLVLWEKALRRLKSHAPYAIIEEVRTLVERTEQWCGWPSDEDVEAYCRDEKFARVV